MQPLDRIIGHRGANRLAPENTMASFRAAHESGAKSIELDIHKTQDGKLVVMHDTSVDRTTEGRGEIGDLTSEQVDKLDAGSKFSPQFKGEKVPSLDGVLAWAKDKVAVDIEIKQPGLEKELVDLIAAHGAGHRVVVSSFSTPALDGVRALNPDLVTGQLLKGTPLKKFAAVGSTVGLALGLGAAALSGVGLVGVALLGIGGLVAGAWGGRRALQHQIVSEHRDDPAKIILPHWSLTDRWLTRQLQESGHSVVPWTADNPKIVNYLLGHCHADGVITDDPGRFT